MRRIAHIVNPVIVPTSSDLHVAQPVTFEAMRQARRFAAGAVAVDLFTAQYPEDRALVPDDFAATSDLQRSVLDVGSFQIARKLPLIRDILDRVYEAAPRADVLIYSNVDIAPQPYFYRTVDAMFDAACDAMVVNRRTITNAYDDVRDLPLMCAQLGRAHPGYDCFIFRRDAYSRFVLNDLCIGTSRVGLGMIANLIAWSQRFELIADRKLTFHLGDDAPWSHGRHADYVRHNQEQVLSILRPLLHDEPAPPGRERLQMFLRSLADRPNVAFLRPIIGAGGGEPGGAGGQTLRWRRLRRLLRRSG